MPEEDFKILDWVILAAFFAWLICFYPFILFNSPEEIDSKYQMELLGYGFTFLILTGYGGYAHHLGKHISLKNQLVAAWISVKGVCTDIYYSVLDAVNIAAGPWLSFLQTPVRHLGRLLYFPEVYYHGNVVLDALIYCSLYFSGLAALFCLIFDRKEFNFLMQIFTLQALYAVFVVACCKEYTLHRLLNHVGYICAFVGYIYESLQYTESYFPIHIGLSTVLLNMVWYMLNYPLQGTHSGSSAPDERPADDHPPAPPPDDDPGAGPSPPRDDQGRRGGPSPPRRRGPGNKDKKKKKH